MQICLIKSGRVCILRTVATALKMQPKLKAEDEVSILMNIKQLKIFIRNVSTRSFMRVRCCYINASHENEAS